MSSHFHFFRFHSSRSHSATSSSGLSFKQHSKAHGLIQAFTVFAASFSFAFLCGSLTFIPNESNATEEGYGNGTDGSIAFSIDKPSLNLTVSNAALVSLVTDTVNMTVTTDNLTGYSLTMSTEDSSTALVHTNGTDSIPMTASTTAAELASNTWGYNQLVPVVEGTSSNSFKAVPTVPTVINSTTTPTDPIAGDSTELIFGVKADMSKPAGLYSTELVYSAVANFVPVTITSIGPNTNLWEGDTINIYGQYLNNIKNIYIDGDATTGTACTSFTEVSSTHATCVLPAMGAGIYNVVVDTVFGESNADALIIYVDNSPPIVSAISSSTNWTGGDVYIEGSKFTDATQVTVGDTNCQSFKLISDTLIRCTIPDKATGSSQAIVVTANNRSSSSNKTITYDGANKGNMQDFTWTQCEAMERGEVQVWTDSRTTSADPTAQKYRIKKMADGKCWMIDNLRYAYGTEVATNSGKYLTVDGTNTQSTANSDVAKYVNPDSTNSKNYGYLYNWYAANYGTGKYSESTKYADVSGNICPNSGDPGTNSAASNKWRLPKGTATSTSDIGTLNAAMAGDDGTTTNWTTNNSSSNDAIYYSGFQPAGSFQGVLSGAYNSGLYGQGSYAYYWSSTVYSATSSSNLRFDSGYVGPALTAYKYYGLAVRCLVSS